MKRTSLTTLIELIVNKDLNNNLTTPNFALKKSSKLEEEIFCP